MKQAVTLLPRDSQDGAFYRAVLNIHHCEYEVAQQLIEQTRDMLDTELTALAAESYQRAYPIMIQVRYNMFNVSLISKECYFNYYESFYFANK